MSNPLRQWRYRLARRRMDRMPQFLADAMFRQIVGRWRYERRRDCREATHFDTLPNGEGGGRD